jgi:hypothetical protein
MEELRVTITKDRFGDYTDIHYTVYEYGKFDKEIIECDFCQINGSSVTEARRVIKDIFKMRRFNGGRLITVLTN